MADSNRDLQERRVNLSEIREQRFQRAQEQREANYPRSGGGWSPGRAARTVTSRSGSYSGKGTLAALLLVGFVIVAIRLVADAEVSDDGTTVKAKVLHPSGELGPIPILAALIATFFVLSFVAIGGGLRAKLAVIMGGAVVLTLGVRSLNEIKFVGSTFGKIGTITAPAPAGQLSDIYGNAGSAGGSGSSGGASAGGVAGAGEAVSQGLLGASSANAYKADLAALEKLNLVKVVGDSVVFVGDATASLAKKALSALGL